MPSEKNGNSADQPKGKNTEKELLEEKEGSTSDLASDLEKAKTEYLYLRAEFDNFRKQTIKERSELVKYGNERLLVELLNVVDIFDRALATEVNSQNIESYKEGFNLTYVEFKSILERFGITPIEALGKPFDPNIHQALSSEATDKYPVGHVSQVFKKPFRLHDRVIRPGQVVVVKEKPTDPKNT